MFMVMYLGFAVMNLYKIMYPLYALDISGVPESNLVRPLWKDEIPLHMKVYLASNEKFNAVSVLQDEFREPNDSDSVTREINDSVLLWEQRVKEASLSKSFLITTKDCEGDNDKCSQDSSYAYAVDWLDTEEKKDGGILAELKAGEGIESTSMILTLYYAVADQMAKLLQLGKTASESVDEPNQPPHDSNLDRQTVSIPVHSNIWKSLQSNSTLHIHVIITKEYAGYRAPENRQDARLALQQASSSHSLLLGQVDLVKYDAPDHIKAPGRILYHDVVWLLRRHVTGGATEYPPWDMAHAKAEEYRTFQSSREMKEKGSGYPFWKPQVSIKYVNDNVLYPLEYCETSGMNIVRFRQVTRLTQRDHPTGYGMMPALHVDEMGLTSEKYIPINETITTLPLRLSFDRSDMEDDQVRRTATAGGMSPARWRLMTHLSRAIESQKELGFEQSDIDDLRRLIADTNVMLLAITIAASSLHLLFEFLTFKNEVSFWQQNKDLTGLSVRSLFLDLLGQVVILLFLIEKDSSLLMIIPAACGCLIALWKCQRGAGFAFVKIRKTERLKSAVNTTDTDKKVSWYNILPHMAGYELKATRLEIKEIDQEDKQAVKVAGLKAMTIETDRMATRTLGSILLPLVLAYTLYSFAREEHTGWYSWLITSASSAVYALGFVLMTPQLFLNYKMKSVAHLPWRVLVYKFLNTFIDDLFAFIIRMPTMARLSCFRDDIVFIVYLYQRWLYPVDTSRPVEGGDGSNAEKDSTGSDGADKEKKDQ